jgi:hypothetical protein
MLVALWMVLEEWNTAILRLSLSSFSHFRASLRFRALGPSRYYGIVSETEREQNRAKAVTYHLLGLTSRGHHLKLTQIRFNPSDKLGYAKVKGVHGAFAYLPADSLLWGFARVVYLFTAFTALYHKPYSKSYNRLPSYRQKVYIRDLEALLA